MKSRARDSRYFGTIVGQEASPLGRHVYCGKNRRLNFCDDNLKQMPKTHNRHRSSDKRQACECESPPSDLGTVLRETPTDFQVQALDLAASIQMAPMTLRRPENGQATMAIDSLFKIFDEFEIEIYASIPRRYMPPNCHRPENVLNAGG